MTGGSRRSRLRHQRVEELSLVITCAACGKPIELVADRYGVTVPDREGFLVRHAQCLQARPLLQRPT